MFEIRVICEPAETDRVVAALDSAFTAGTMTVCPTRNGRRHRLYVTADHRPEPGPWPTPEKAYALAPSITSEIGWTARTIATAECFTELDREYYLRKAALLDRVALIDEPDEPHGDATETAEATALYLLDTDSAQTGSSVPAHAAENPRGYIRQEYARWAKNQ